jgi:hypothetical protein
MDMSDNYVNRFKKIILVFWFITYLLPGQSNAQINLSTDYFKISIDKKGFITSMKNITKTPNQEFSPKDKPSPLLRLYNSNKTVYYEPQKAVYSKTSNVLSLTYVNGSIAKIKIEAKAKYFKLTLQSLTTEMKLMVYSGELIILISPIFWVR